MDAQDDEITEATEAFKEDNWEDEGDDFFDELLEEETNDDPLSPQLPSVRTLKCFFF